MSAIKAKHASLTPVITRIKFSDFAVASLARCFENIKCIFNVDNRCIRNPIIFIWDNIFERVLWEKYFKGLWLNS